MIRLTVSVLEDIYYSLDATLSDDDFYEVDENGVCSEYIQEDKDFYENLIRLVDEAKPDKTIVFENARQKYCVLDILDNYIDIAVGNKHYNFKKQDKLQMDFCSVSLREYISALNTITDEEMSNYAKNEMSMVTFSLGTSRFRLFRRSDLNKG